MKAMILAAGLGTRLKPFTNSHPKALAVVNGKTLLQRSIEYLSSFNIKDVIINVHHFSDQIIDLIKKNNGFGSNITISDETNEVLETGGGLKKAEWFFADHQPFVLLNVDILSDMDLKNIIDEHTTSKALATLVVAKRNTSRYFLFDELNRLCGWRNTNTNEQKINREALQYFEKAFWGIHIISPEIFNLIMQEGKFSIVDVYMSLVQSHTIIGFEDNQSKFIDVGKPESIALAEELFL
jgi:NDP-sugar pyrophosphorylase family protein